MKEKALAAGQTLWNGFLRFTPGQKVVSLAALGALIVGGYFLLTWTPATTYAPLYTNLAPADASAIVDKLNSAGISYQLGAGGTEVLVPQDKVYSTRLTMSSAGLPGDGQTGYSLLDKEGVTTSQFKQQVDYQRAIEGELAKTIQSIDGVTAASVHLAIPQQDVFNDGSQKPTAAVLLTTGAATTLTQSQVQSVVYLVSSSVPGMQASGVTVTDSNGTVLKAPGQGDSPVVDASTQTQATQAYDSQLQAKLQAALDTYLGPNHSTVTVNSQLNFNQTDTTKRSYVYDKNAPPVSETTTRENYQGANANGAGGTLGTAPNAGTTAANGNGKYVKSSKTVDNALGTITQTTHSAPGQVAQLSIAVALDKNVKNVNVAAISQLMKSGSGFSAARGDSLSVQAIPFDTSTQQAATAASAAAAKQTAAAASHKQLMSLIKQGALGLLVLALIVAAAIGARKRKRTVPEPGDDVLGLDEEFADDELTNHDLAQVADIRTAAERRRSLAAAADNRPEDVARVLSGWLNTKES